MSFDIPEYSGDITALGTTRILEAVRRSGNGIKFYQASSSEMFGGASPPQNEDTSLQPKSPYACAKVYAYWITRNYREGYRIFACNGILFNHESPRRGETFVTRKITRGVSRILARKRAAYLGNLNAKGTGDSLLNTWNVCGACSKATYRRTMSWGRASTFVEEFLDKVFSYAGLDKEKHVKIDPKYFRPTEVESLIADARKAKKALGWDPKIKFDDLVKIMVDADMRAIGLEPIGEGDRILEKKFPGRWWRAD